MDSLVTSETQPALTICWYRVSALACPNPNERADLLGGAGVCDPPLHLAPDNSIVACDPGGEAYGRVVTTPDCPTEVTAGSDVLSPSIGRDVATARVVCTYAVTESSVCGGGHIPMGLQ